METGPGWCFDRFGQSSTKLADGRIILIAGEHEDHYDPDFYIYNDVVILYPDGKVDIFGYPREIFPPTDFHTATLVENRIVIIDCLGYQEERRPGITPVFTLDLGTFSVSPVLTSGMPPGWLHQHEAGLSEDRASIVIQHGELDRGGADTSLVENIDDWKLHLAGWRWERLTDRRWQRWEVVQKDRKPNHLWEIQTAAFSQRVDWEKEFKEKIEELTRKLGAKPDLSLMAELFNPAVPHETLPDKNDSHNVHRIMVQDVIVRYVEDWDSVQMTIEGELPPTIIEALTADLAYKISALENSPVDLNRL